MTRTGDDPLSIPTCTLQAPPGAGGRAGGRALPPLLRCLTLALALWPAAWLPACSGGDVTSDRDRRIAECLKRCDQQQAPRTGDRSLEGPPDSQGECESHCYQTP